MFRNLFKELERLEAGTSVSIPVEADERGYVDKECPAANCRDLFKVLEHDWRHVFREEQVFCPRCGHSAPADQWWTTEQVEQAQGKAFAQVQSRISKAIRRDARDFNRRQPREGFIKMSMKAHGAEHPSVIVPLKTAEILEQCIECEQCHARYAVLGPAFFCPCCGGNSIDRMFGSALDKVRAKASRLDTIREALSREANRDIAESLCRSILESGIKDCVVAFQNYAYHRYVSIAGVTNPPANVFQRLDRGSELWRETTGKGYEDWLAPGELDHLRVLFQRRHLLAHTDGIVDQKYLDNSGDSTYRVGQRIVVTANEVVEMASLTAKLGDAIRRAT